ncbi:MAG: hypothetical protein ACI4S4_03150 [Candidatus Ornithospirochaeta sp.]
MELSTLYFGEGGEEKFRLFLRKNEDHILSFLDDDLSLELTKFSVSGVAPVHRNLFEALGLISGMSVTERGMKIVSLYPLFGRRTEDRGRYSTLFFPFLFSLLSKGLVPSRRERFFSSPLFTSLFPWRDPEVTERAAEKAVDSLIEMRVVSIRGNRLSLDMEGAVSFMEKDELTRLAYILLPHASQEERRRAKHFLSLSTLIGENAEEEMEELLSFISSSAGISIPKEDLLLFGIIEEKGGKYSATLIDDSMEGAVASSDMTLSYRGNTRLPLWRFAKPGTADSFNVWTVDKEGIKAALDGGMTEEEILSAINAFSHSVPDTMVARISAWCSEYKRIRSYRATVLETDERCALIISSLSDLKPFIFSRIGENVFVMDGEKEEEWRKILSSSGFEMLMKTQGPEFSPLSPSPQFSSLPSFPTIPLERTVPFSSSKYNNTLSKAKDYIQKCLIESHLVFSSKTVLKIEWIDGLDYREKRDETARAVQEKLKIATEDTNGNQALLTPISLDESNEEKPILVTEEGRYDFAKITDMED